jgi:hypothetical protein
MSEGSLPTEQTFHYKETAEARKRFLRGDKVDDLKVIEYLEASAQAFDDLRNAEFARAGGDKYSEAAAENYAEFAVDDRRLVTALQRGGISKLDGRNSRDLLVERDILVSSDSSADVSGLSRYIEAVEKRWREASNS